VRQRRPRPAESADPSSLPVPRGPVPWEKTHGHELDYEVWWLRQERPDLSARRAKGLILQAEFNIPIEQDRDPYVPPMAAILEWVNANQPVDRRGAPSGWRGTRPLREEFAAACRVVRQRTGARPTQDLVARELGYADRSGLMRALRKEGLSFEESGQV
jgi:hypothetical protein